MPLTTALVFASGTLTSDETDVAGDATQAIGGKTYTFKASYSNTDGHVTKGASATATLDNLVAAINLGTGSGSLYAAVMTKNDYVRAVKTSAFVVTLVARTPGILGNLVTIGTAPTHLTRSGANLASGSGYLDTFFAELEARGQVNSDLIATLARAHA
jgi:hypothetical protein